MFSYIVKVLYDMSNQSIFLNMKYASLIMLSVILFFITVALSKEYYKDHNSELEKFISLYKKTLNNKL